MSTYAIMQARIADEVARTDLTTQIARAILSAITHHERRRFYFNETIDTFTTVANQEWYSSTDATWIASAVDIDSLRVTISSRPYTINKRDMTYMESVSAGSVTVGDPTDWCWYRQQIRIYPTPNAARTVTGAFIKRFTTLSADDDTNAWMVEGEALIRTRAKIILWEEVIRGDAGKAEGVFLRTIEADLMSRLAAETAKHATSGQVVARY